MADLKISQLNSIVTVVPATDVLPVVQGGTTLKITPNQILGAGGTATLASATITGALTSGTTTLVSHAAGYTGKVGIGTATPTYTLDVSSSSNIVGRISSSNVFNTGFNITNTTASTWSLYSFGSNDATLQNSFGIYHQNGTAFLQITNTGNVGVGVTPAGTGGCLQLKSGITFPATQSASSDANTLDDYEEGTWTPVVTAVSGTLGSVTGQTGTYTKIGRMVTATGYFQITTNGSGSSAVALAGLPFANGGLANIGVGRVDGTTGNMVQVKINASASTANIWTYNNSYPAADGSAFPITLVYYV